MDEKILMDLGFDEKGAKIYLKLLKLGSSSASKLSAELGYDRTTTYYSLLRMLDKGQVHESIQNNVKMFSATAPADILSLYQEKQQRFKDIVPDLEAMYQKQSDFCVEVRQGKEGIRHLYRDAIKVGGEVLGLGIDDGQYIDLDDLGLKQYYRDAQEKKMRERLLTYKGARMVGSPITKYRYVDKKFFQPTPIFIYGEKIVMVNWNPTIHLVYIQSKELSDAFRKHFEALWSIGKKLK